MNSKNIYAFIAIFVIDKAFKMEEKYLKLVGILKEMGEVVVAYSGGVDSAFLLKTATDTLGKKAKGILAVSPSYPSRELDLAKQVAVDIGANISIIETHETEQENYLKNPLNRCYYCKSELFEKIIELAGDPSIKNMVDGSNYDDLGDHRPGMKALRERGVRSPLQEAELTKHEIRELSKKAGLPTWDKEALACLSSRFPYGERIDVTKLRMVDDMENFLRDMGFKNIRARHQNKTLKIEVYPADIKRFFNDDIRKKVVDFAKKTGYTYVTIDLEGYRQGSMNEVIKKSDNLFINKKPRS